MERTPTARWVEQPDGSFTPEPVVYPQFPTSKTTEGNVGAPTAGMATRAGLYYFRSDTPSTANQRIYVSTAVGTWVGIL